jgi:F-type H+-transporting ATPase subunit delta
MRRPKLARRYAKAFFEFSQEQNKVEDVIKDIRFIENVLSENKDFKVIISSPIIRVDKKVAILNEIFKSRVDAVSLQYLTLIFKKGRECELDLICDEYDKLYKKFKRIATLYIQSAEAVGKNIIESIRLKISSYLDMKIEIIEQINPKLIGGVRLRFNDYLLDASVQGYMERLRRQLVDKSYEVNF